MEPDDYELIGNSPPYKTTWDIGKHTYHGEAVDYYYKSESTGGTKTVPKRGVSLQAIKPRITSKYMPHQGKKECERRRNRGW